MENKSITITLGMEKATKNCVKFVETTQNDWTPEKLGSLYIQKSFLADIGFNGGKIEVMLSQNTGNVKFKFEKATKNTCKFTEIVENEWTPEKIGSIYIPKSTLTEMGYNGGEIYVGVSVAK